MKFLILTQYYPPEMGAPQTRLSELAAGLKDLGWKVGVVTAMPNYPKGKIFEGYTGKFSVKESKDDIAIKRYWLYPSNSARALPRIISMLSFSFTALFSVFFVRKFKPDYIFVESPPLTLGFSGWLLAIFSGSRFVFNVSDLYPLSAKELGIIDEGFLYKSIELLEKFLYRRATFCSGQSREIVDYIKKKGAKKTLLFRNGVNFKRFEGTSGEKRNGKIRLVYAGLLGVAQGIFEICRNVKFGDLNVEFHIYGAGAERDLIENFVSENPDSNVFLHPVVNKQEIPAILKSFDGTIIPLKKNIYGAVPSKIYEAMAAGLPIIYSGEGEACGIIEENQVGWISPASDYRKLEHNINDFAKSAEKRSLYSNNGISSAFNIYNRKIQVEKLHDFLSENLEN
ncbi:MAG: glycosyltransferase family 4 protein [Pyrinomonadaceae bacterium]